MWQAWDSNTGFSFPSVPQGWRCNHSPSGHGCLLSHKPLEAAFPAFCKSEPASSSSLVLRLPWDATDVGPDPGRARSRHSAERVRLTPSSCELCCEVLGGPCHSVAPRPRESQDEDRGLPATGPTSPTSTNTEHLCTRPGPHPQDGHVLPQPCCPPTTMASSGETALAGPAAW